MSDTGITPSAQEAIVEGLKKLLASSYTLFLKTQNYHWNVRGPFFQPLHLLFEQQYTELFTANDEIAERIRALGALAPGSYQEFGSLSFLQEGDSSLSAEAMVEDLMTSQEEIVRFARDLVAVAADAHDEGTVDVLTGRISAHEKSAWMLGSFLGK